MKMLITAIAIAAATPVAAQTANPAGSAHTDHGTPAPDRSDKGCCCCDSPSANKADDDMKKMACCEKASGEKIGRASCRERGCQDLEKPVVAVALKKKTN